MANWLIVPKDYIGVIVTGGRLLPQGSYAENDVPAFVDVDGLVSRNKAHWLQETVDENPPAADPPQTPETVTPENPPAEDDTREQVGDPVYALTQADLESKDIAELKAIADDLAVKYASNIGHETLVSRILETISEDLSTHA